MSDGVADAALDSGGGRPTATTQVIFIVGMGRSGTSAMTRLLSLCGAGLPKVILPPSPDNEWGFWEPEHAIRLNDAVLERRGSSWYDPAAPRFTEEDLGHTGELVEFLRRGFHEAPAIVLKDPRTAAVLPLWLRAAATAGLQAKVVHIYRHPDEVAESLRVRERLESEHALAMWLKDNLLAERHSRHLPRITVSYSQLTADPRAVARTCIEMLDLPLIVADQAVGSISADLRHHRAEIVSDPTPLRWVSRLYEALEQARAGERPVEVFDRIGSEYLGSAAFFSAAFASYEVIKPAYRAWARHHIRAGMGAEAPSDEAVSQFEGAELRAGDVLGRENARLGRFIELLRKDMEDTQARTREEQGLRQALEVRLAGAEASRDQAMADVAALEVRLEARVAELTSRVRQQKAELEDGEADLKVVLAQLEDRDAALKELESRREELAQSLIETRDRLSGNEFDLSEKVIEAAWLADERAKLLVSLETTTAAWATADSDRATVDKDRDTVIEQLRRFHGELLSTAANRDRLRARLLRAESESDRLREDLQQLGGDHAAARIELLRRQDELSATQSAMSARREEFDQLHAAHQQILNSRSWRAIMTVRGVRRPSNNRGG